MLNLDAVRLSQVLVIILSNAVKFSYDKSTIVVRAQICKADDTNQIMKIFVVDKGIGIA